MARALIYRAPREHERCPACGSPGIEALALHVLRRAIDGRRVGFVSGCVACGLVFANPLPTDEELAATYSPEGLWGGLRQDEPPVEVPAQRRKRGRWAPLFDAIRDELDVTAPPPGRRVLDFGCGRGALLDTFRSWGWETFGIEPAVDAAFPRHARLVDIPSTPSFDFVIAHHVLEHVPDPLSLLRRFAAAARENGYLLIGVPRLDTLPTHRDYGYVINRVHITAYTSTCLQGLLARAGWKLVEAPPDEVLMSGGRRTTARLRVLARRVTTDVALPVRPLEPALAALRAYNRLAPPPSLLERAGAIRLAARMLSAKPRRYKRVPAAV
jgi:SAM-dependent methyltransferase